MLTKRGKLQSIEGVLADLLMKLGVTEAQHIHDEDTEKRSGKLLKMALKALRKLDEEGDDARALSMEPPLPDEQERACDVLSRRMGVMPNRGA